METPLLNRSKALNNIPEYKLNEKRMSVIRNCSICSARENKYSIDGLCEKCRWTFTAYNRYLEANIPLEYWDLKMDKDFSGDKRLLEKYHAYISDLRNISANGKSICFSGRAGTGKTMTSTAILQKACQKGYSCLYTTLYDVVNVLTQAPFDEQYCARRELTMVGFLVIDEFDSRFIGTDNAANLYARTLEMIFRTRTQNKLPTIMCTNSPNIIETFTGQMKESLDSLIKGYIEIFPVLGEDFRKRKINEL